MRSSLLSKDTLSLIVILRRGSRKLVSHTHYIRRATFTNTAADLSATPTHRLLSHFSNCPPGLWCRPLSKKKSVVVLLGSVALGREVVFSRLLLLPNCRRTKVWMSEGEGGRGAVNQVIHDMWSIRHQSNTPLPPPPSSHHHHYHPTPPPSCCVCVRVCVCFNCEKCNKSASALNRQTVVLRCPEGLGREQWPHIKVSTPDKWWVTSLVRRERERLTPVWRWLQVDLRRP